MSIETTIRKIQTELISAFAELDSWFDQADRLSQNIGRWSRVQILEHVMLTNHFLLILIEKGTRRASQNASSLDLAVVRETYSFDVEALLEISKPGAFVWESPSHMEPSGLRDISEIRSELRNQLYRCLCLMDMLSKGEGAAYKMTMSVNNLGKLDMYQYVYFLILHVQRHLRQLQTQPVGMETSSGS